MISRISTTAILFVACMGAIAQAGLAPRYLPLDELPSGKVDGVGPLMNKMIRPKTAQGVCKQPEDGGFLEKFSPPPSSTFDLFGIPVILADGVTQTTVPIPILELSMNLLLDRLATDPFAQDSQSFGRNGEHTSELAAQHQLCMDFWKTDQESVEPILVGWHSEPLGELTEMKRAIESYLAYQNPSGENLVTLLALTDVDIEEIALATMLMIETELPDDYSNPLLTFNAFASPFVKVNGVFPGSIVMGDGILDYLSSLGFDKVTNDVIHAHEFGHILQFIAAFEDSGYDVDKFIDIMFDVTPEESRRIELKADAYAAYFLAHEQGRNFEIPLLMQAARASFAIGDCSVQSTGHHGTPVQRECATLWGADQGLQNGKDPLPFREFRDLFDQNLQLILNADPSVCSGELMEENVSDEVKFSDDLLIGSVAGKSDATEDDPSDEDVDLSTSSSVSSINYSCVILGALVAPLLLLS